PLPYTTPFRSGPTDAVPTVLPPDQNPIGRHPVPAIEGKGQVKLHLFRHIVKTGQPMAGILSLALGPDLSHARVCVLPPQKINGDRKSTRLNSSHVKISYAVFCLKKIN